jgi:WhiB family redox-sensing transcriptional regulator
MQQQPDRHLQAAESHTRDPRPFCFSHHNEYLPQEVTPMQLAAFDAAERLGAELPCRSFDPELFFAELPADVEYAKSLCTDCPVRATCLAGALERREPWGVWRRALRPGRRRAAQAAAGASAQVGGSRVSGAPASDRRIRRQPASIDRHRAEMTTTFTDDHIANRSTEMQLMHEDLARAHSQLRLEEAVRRERAHRLWVAHRAARRAEQASMRARRLLASVVAG